MKVGSMSSKMGLEFDGMATATSSAGGFGSSPKAMCSSASSIGSISPKADKAMGGTTKSGLSEKSRASPIGRAVEEDDEIAELTENAEVSYSSVLLLVLIVGFVVHAASPPSPSSDDRYFFLAAGGEPGPEGRRRAVEPVRDVAAGHAAPAGRAVDIPAAGG